MPLSNNSLNLYSTSFLYIQHFLHRRVLNTLFLTLITLNIHDDDERDGILDTHLFYIQFFILVLVQTPPLNKNQ